MKQSGCWARSDQNKINTFAEYLVKVFIPNARKMEKKRLLSVTEN